MGGSDHQISSDPDQSNSVVSPGTWGDSDIDRLDPQVYQDLARPDSCIALMQMARDYMSRLRNLPEDRADDEIVNVDKFVRIINNDIAWPLVKSVVPEFRHPM